MPAGECSRFCEDTTLLDLLQGAARDDCLRLRGCWYRGLRRGGRHSRTTTGQLGARPCIWSEKEYERPPADSCFYNKVETTGCNICRRQGRRVVTRRRSVQASAARLRPVGGARVRPTCESGRGSETESALARGRPPHSHRPASPSASRCIVRQGGQGSKACRGTSRSQWPTGRIAVSSSGKGSRRRPASNPRHGPPTRRSWWSFGILAVVIAGGVVLNRVLTGREDGAGTEPGGYPNIQRAEPGAH